MDHPTFSSQDDFEKIEEKLQSVIQRATEEHDHPFRYPTLATAGEQGPHQRTLVLREYDVVDPSFLFYTDKRTAKVEELRLHAGGSLHVYHPELKLQLRFRGQLEVLSDGELWQRHFGLLPERQYREYGYERDPGDALEHPDKEWEVSVERVKKNFALLRFTVATMEALQLGDDHHLRIEFRYPEGSADWLMP